MTALELIGLFSYTFGAFCFGGFLLVRRRRRSGASGSGVPEPAPSSAFAFANALNTTLMALSFAWFVVHAVLVLVEQHPRMPTWPLQTIVVLLAFSFPPLVMHVTCMEGRASGNRLDHPLWRASVLATYAISFSVCATCLLGFYKILTLPVDPGRIVGFAIGALFTVTGIYGGLALSRARPRSGESAPERGSRRAMTVLYAMLIGLCALIIAASLDWIDSGAFFNLLTKNLPLAFIFVGVFFGDRFQFFDLFVKRGAALLLTVVLFAGWFAVSMPLLGALELGWARPWVQAVVLLPLLTAVLWVIRLLAKWLDSVWLGRRYAPLEGLKAFLVTLQQATHEQQLVERAEAGLTQIFRAPARIVLEGDTASAPFELVEEAPIRLGGVRVGTIQLGRRDNQMPYFSEDSALIASLGDVFASTLANVRLQRKEREQAERARELTLHASRSELKALRAQVNPHFLFNALNAIAGLIHRDPLRADRTVEQLAEVFRYTLRRSEQEWTRLEDELAFVSAYLAVEQARFGERLRCSVRCSPRVAAAYIPAMLVQTLVENAVKHGVAEVLGVAEIEVSAEGDPTGLTISVADSGPGFDAEERRSSSYRPKGEGHGLANIRGRLSGHFGNGASLCVARDEAKGRTIVTIHMPEVDAPGGPGVAADPAGAA